MKSDKGNMDDGRVTRRGFMRGAAAAGAGAVLAGRAADALAAMAPAPQGAAASTPVLEMGAPGGFKILQVTDTHMHFMARGFMTEPRISGDIKKMAERFKPDIIVNTGDFWVNKTEAAADTCKWLCKEFIEYKTPWAYAWGNHDESDDYNRTHATLEKAPSSLYRGAAADGNYRIEVKEKGGAAPLWNLIFLNNSRGGFKQEQIDWFNAEAGRIREQTPAPPPAFLFFHIPLPQYDEIVLLGKARGVKFESVCHEDGSRDAFPAFRDAGFVKAAFCGHDHLSDYYGVLEGVRLQYGRALGGYGKEKVRKGGTLITADTAAGTFETKTVFPDGSSVEYDTLIMEPEAGRVY